MLKLLLMVLGIMFLAAIMGFDGLTCGCGPQIRDNINTLFSRSRSG